LIWLKTIALSARDRINRVRIARRRFLNSRRDAAHVFDDIYRTGEWGRGDDAGPYSGTGSRGPVVDAYVPVIAEFVRTHQVSSIVDVGCGDFYVGSRLLNLVGPSVRYIGVDVSSIVIEHNVRVHARANVRFERADASQGPLPDGDLCLVRQVMQHLSNPQIQSMLVQLRKFPYVIVTEHYPQSLGRANADKPHGGDTRLVDRSAVVLDAPPFNVAGLRPLLEVDASISDTASGRLVTVLISNPVHAELGEITR
jgi:SAM-dependent methyltransferase